MQKPMLLMILDGFGFGDDIKGNAIKAANTPHLGKIFNDNPMTLLSAAGLDVGLPEGQMGNSEVGHTTIGAGRVVYQELTRITKSIKEGDFFENPMLLKAVEDCKKNNTNLHVMGLLSDGGVHSHINHILALVDFAKAQGLSNVYLHCFLDGRDTAPTSGEKFVLQVQSHLDAEKFGEISTISGRFFAMDRDNRWDRVEKAYGAMVQGVGETFTSPVDYVKESYQKQLTDEFIPPAMRKNGVKIQEKDSVIFANFRPDRAREITAALSQQNFSNFPVTPLNLTFVTMTKYDDSFAQVMIAYPPEKIENTFGAYISQKGYKQLRIAETEKYAHVTFFFNAGREEEFPGEHRVLVPSPQVKTYDEQPEMNAFSLTEKVLEQIRSDRYDVIVLNYANCDMVGHTGNFDATVKAVEAVDACVGKVVQLVQEKGGIVLITADHGNADKMLDPEEGVFTAHTTNPVPFAVVGKDVTLKDRGKLADIAPTMLELMGLPIPKEITGNSLLS